MKTVKTRGETNVFTAPQGWDETADGKCGGLSVRREVFGASKLRDHVSTWKPTPQELAELNLGGVIELSCVGMQPPVMLTVVAPVESDTVEVPDRLPKTHITINEAAHGFDDHGPAYP